MAGKGLMYIRRQEFNMLKRAYNSILRPILPKKIGTYFSVPAKDKKLFDYLDHQPKHKYELLVNVRENTWPGQKALVFGGGRGLAAVIAARRVLPTGEVTVYEAAQEQCERTRQTVQFNQVEDYVSVRQSIVGSSVDIWGDTEEATHIQPSKLPEANIWIIDIEGGELELLRGAIEADIKMPETVIVETHPDKGASVDEVRSIISESPQLDNLTVNKVDGHSVAIGGDVIVSRFA